MRMGTRTILAKNLKAILLDIFTFDLELFLVFVEVVFADPLKMAAIPVIYT